MTRFARAKGSKSSNERLPDEPTPWHIMKQQLEDSVASKQSPQVKTKTAKELLREREEPYYGELGASNNDWAEFQPEKVKPSKKEESKISSDNRAIKKNKKKHLESDIKNETLADVPVNTEDSAPTPKKSKKRKSNAAIVESAPIKPPDNSDSTENNPPKEKKQKIPKEIVESAQISSENSEGKKKKDKSSTPSDDSQAQKSQLSSENVQENEATDKPTVKLSKRQKRNRKNKLKQSEGDVEAKEDNKSAPGAFNTEGNEWSTEIKVGPKKKSIKSNEEGIPTTDDSRPDKNVQNRDPNTRKDGVKPPNRFDNQKVIKKRKPAKIRDDMEHKRRKPNPGSTKVIINGLEIEIVMYDGFPVKKEDADRLIELRKQMVMKGIPKSEINAAMKLERRKAEKALTRVKKNVCFHCRKAGHNLSDCPDLGKEEVVTGICFKCGSTEHTHFECRVTKKEEFGFAKCFICREQGHIAKQCPDNPKGLYPQGGACKICGDVTHLKKDCPDVVQDKEENTMTLGTISDTVESLGNLENERKIEESKKSKHKIVTF